MTDRLTDYPRPNVAVDVAMLSVRPSTDRPELVALVLHRAEPPEGPVLPGRFLREGETIRDTVAALLEEKLHLRPSLRLSPRLLRVFDAPGRDERGWTISIGHSLALPWEVAAQAHGDWRPVTGSGTVRGARLLFDHATILSEAVTRMRDRYDPYHLLTGEFSLLDLRRLHEAVLGEPLRKDTFNRRMRAALEPTGEASSSIVLQSTDASIQPLLGSPSPSLPTRTARPGRAAQLYRHPRASRRSSESLWRLPRER